jgi:hypothetical protein
VDGTGNAVDAAALERLEQRGEGFDALLERRAARMDIAS